MIADVSALAVVATAVVNLALAVLAGVLAARLWLRRDGGAAAPGMRGHVLAAWIAIAGAALLLLLDQASRLMDTPLFAAWEGARLLATSTFSGQAMTAVGVLAALAAALAAARRAFVPAALAGFAAVTAIRSAMGHAGQDGILSLAVLVEWVHLLAMSLWVGCVIVSGWIVLPALHDDRGALFGRYAVRMSHWATGALAVIIASGVFNTARVLEQPSDLLSTAYGQLLLAKIAAVVLAVGLGGINRTFGIPALQGETGAAHAPRRVIVILKTESCVLAVVVLLAAVLTNAAPHG